MKRETTPASAFIAVVMTVVLLFTTQFQIAAPAFYIQSDDADSTAARMNRKIETQEMKDLLSPDTLAASYGRVHTELPKHTGSPISPDDVLSDIFDSVGDDITENEPIRPVEKEGVSIIPAQVNNIIRDSLASVISSNVYTFSLEDRGVVVYAFNHTDSEAKSCLWNITLYEEYSPDGSGKKIAYRELNQTEYTTVGTGVQSAAIGVLPGNYRLVVECITGFTADKYDVAIGFAAADNYEIECNDSMTRYTYLPLDKTFGGSVSEFSNDAKKDEDWFMFEITDKGYTVLYFDHEADTDNTAQNVAWKISITDSDGREYYAADSTMNTTELNSGIMGLPEGYYFVSVKSHIRSGKPYTLTVAFTADSAIETELNDSPETAVPLTANAEMIGSLTQRDTVSDRDYYTFTMEHDGFITLGFTHEALSEQHDGWNVTILSENGRVIFREVSDWTQSVLQTPEIGLAAGRYYVLVDSDNLYFSSIVYRLVLIQTENSHWESEPNNTAEDADELTLGVTVNGTMTAIGVDFDKDYFKFIADSAGEISISFGHIVTDEKNKEGWIISLVNADGTVVACKKSYWDTFETTFTADVNPGEWYILVETGLHFNSSAYILNVKMS